VRSALLAIAVSLGLAGCSEVEPLLMAPVQASDANARCSAIRAELDANDAAREALTNASGKEMIALQARQQTLTNLEFQRCAPPPPVLATQ
jgi:hypothetical protein